MDLLPYPGFGPTLPVMHAGRTFRQKIGDRLLLEREQVKHWTRARAAQALGVDGKTIERIEQAGNVGLDYVERYAIVLGLSLERVCRDVLSEPLEVPFSSREEVQRLAPLLERYAAMRPEFLSSLTDAIAGAIRLSEIVPSAPLLLPLPRPAPTPAQSVHAPPSSAEPQSPLVGARRSHEARKPSKK
jgi:hypothetical protein